ncbi:helix-turn-helix domain-containing protein [Methylobacterium pseudosasicola]|uniref:Transcriptional regulator, AraC family n=1 Tax=Methylobacterium pseudosasicola TaxID=582667 RepID=A0A1I4H526_9HYPH|nr:helix-turn-helix domain-containing protein [Methylobacterium pseudosasicola]SFL37388.1 transcriptional regulator, AraC family [Methylobacterium pseudosasicola]
MSRPALVPSSIQTTRHIEPKRAFEFWRATALAPFGDVGRVHARDAFRAKRLVVAGAGWGLTHTVSSPVGLTIGARQVDRSGPETVVIGLGLDGIGYQQQGERGGRLGAGDISFLSRQHPLVAGTQSDYAELRLALPRATFEAWIGTVDAFAGRCIADRPEHAAFKAAFHAFAAAAAWMTEEEAWGALEGVLHLLGTLVRDPAERPGAAISCETVASLARAHIVRRLHDPQLGPAEIHAALGVSRAQLYRAFAGTDGVAATIRDARLDLAHRRLAAPRTDGMKIATIAYACGFTDVPTFNRAFRQRFGLSPRALRAGAGDPAGAPI